MSKDQPGLALVIIIITIGIIMYLSNPYYYLLHRIDIYFVSPSLFIKIVEGLGAKEKVALAKKLILMKLPDDNYEILNFLIRFLTEVSEFFGCMCVRETFLLKYYSSFVTWSLLLINHKYLFYCKVK